MTQTKNAYFPSPSIKVRVMIRAVDPLISISEAEALIRKSLPNLEVETVKLASAAGRILAEPLIADRPLPPFPRAMMDGIAFRAAQTEIAIPLKIVGLHAAGNPPPRKIKAGEAWEIMTGAAVPDDCDTIVPYEDIGAEWSLEKAPNAGQFIHPLGHDAVKDQILVTAGCRIGPAEISIAASIGMTELIVYRLPKIALITTGDEAIPIGDQPEAWQIRRSNGAMIEAALHRLGFPVNFISHIADEPISAAEIIRAALANSDLVILCGGISMGKKDYVRSLLENELGKPAFHGVKLRPGKPFAYWTGTPQVFALPGNPVSVLATFTRFVVPALYRFQGGYSAPVLKISAKNISPLPEFTWLLPVAPDGTGECIPRPPKNSGDYVSIAGSIGMIEVPPQADLTSSSLFSFYPFP